MSALMVTTMSWAQDRTVSGKVSSADDGSALPGVNVVVKGTATGGVTDIDGNYKVSVPEDAKTLVFSFIGLETQEVEIGTRSVIDVQMASDVQQLSEVVVTALGTTQNARDVTYANQTVKAEDLLTSPDKNALEALRGKTAGVKITTGSGSVGASTRIVLRGESSLTGDNNALIVVDGIPIDNSSTFGGLQEGEGGYADYGNRFNDFDPNNIESITILKGPSATSLYGSRGASGVVLITTKRGSKKGFTLNVNSTSSVEQAYILLERQDQYGQGLINPDGSTSFDSGENFSWGPKFDGVVRPWTSPVDTDGDGTYEYLSRPYSAVENQLQNFFRLGSTFTNSISMSGGDDRFTYYASYGNTTQNGILENTDYQRNSITVNTKAQFNEKVSTSLNMTYSLVDQNTAQEGSRAFEGQNPYASAVQAAVNIPYTELRDYNNPYHSFEGYYGSYTVNPYFILNEFTNNAKTKNFLSGVSLEYKPVDGLTLNTRFGLNLVSLNRVTIIPQYSYSDHYVWEDNLTLTPRGGRQENAGEYSELTSNSQTIDWTTTASYTRALDSQEKYRMTVTGGLNLYDVQRKVLTGSTQGGLVIPEVYNLANSVDRALATQNHSQKRIIGLFGNLNFGWDDKVFIEYSARNDWSSTLPVDNQAFFYQSIGGSAIVSDFLDLDGNPIMNYFKFRASFGTTGKDADIHLLSSNYIVNPTLVDYQDIYDINTPLGGQTGITKSTLIGNSTLKPELTTTFEVGADMNFWSDKIELAYTYYKSNSTNQIVVSELPRSTGYLSTPVNVGELQNQGHEVSLTFTPLDFRNGFKWVMNLTWAKNTSEVIKISDQSDELTIYNSGRGITLTALVGEPFGTWKGQAPLYEPGTNNPIVDANGSQVYSTENQVLGNVQPDWIGGLVNTFSWKGLSLGFVLDKRQGGKIFSLTKSATEFNGTALTTLIGDRKPFIIPNSVVDNGDGTYSENTTPILADAYVFDGNYGRNLLDGSFLKLREVTLGYDLPKSVVNKIKLQNVSVQLFAKNLKYWLAEENTFGDPEVNGPSGTANNIQGVESTQTPNSRSFGFNVNITL